MKLRTTRRDTEGRVMAFRLRPFLLVCLFVLPSLNLNTTKPRTQDFCVQREVKKSPDRSFLVPEKWSPV